MKKSGVKHLLMGGQACVLYGAAEFSRDVDLAILANDKNLESLKKCLKNLGAELIAVPEFDLAYLERGHAIHFRCKVPEAAGMRIDIMSKMRGMDPFLDLWKRRTTFEINDGLKLEVLNIWDLVRAKKTQRDKDWPMIRRLVEANFYGSQGVPSTEQLRFWLLELRTPEILIQIARTHRELSSELVKVRPLLADALAMKAPELAVAIANEEQQERQEDRAYWTPLKAELEQLRFKGKRRGKGLK